MTKNKFISFEGIEGCGKTTQANLIAEYFKNQGQKTWLTREPGGTKEAEAIRKLFLNHKFNNISAAALNFAARAEHIEQVIKPKLDIGEIVITDRFIDSTAAYQGISDKLYELHNALFCNLMPSVTFFIDIDPKVAMSRISERGDPSFFDKQGLEFHNRIRENYKILASKFVNRIITINANNKTHDQIHNEIIDQSLPSIL